MIEAIQRILTSTGFKISGVFFVFVIAIGFLITYINEKKKKDKYISRIEKHRKFAKTDVIDELQEKQVNSETYNKYIRPYIGVHREQFDKILKILGIDLYDIQRTILRANANGVSAEQIAAFKVIGIFALLITIIPFIIFMGTVGALISFLLFFIFAIYPTTKLNQQYLKRKQEIEDTLPTYLKLLANATSAGNTIEEAIKKVDKKYPCILSDEFNKVEQEVQYSNDWIQALENMAFKNDIEELYNLVSEIKITKEKGTPITDVLITRAEKIESEKVFTIAEKARKKATILIFPIFLFLFMPLFAIVLLPTIDLITTAW